MMVLAWDLFTKTCCYVSWACADNSIKLFLIKNSLLVQMEFDEKELRREISYAIKNIHGIRHVSCTRQTTGCIAL